MQFLIRLRRIYLASQTGSLLCKLNAEYGETQSLKNALHFFWMRDRHFVKQNDSLRLCDLCVQLFIKFATGEGELHVYNLLLISLITSTNCSKESKI